MNSLNNDREIELKNQFNAFFQKYYKKDLYEQLSIEEMIKLKKVVSCINNIITLRATKAFIELLCRDHFIDDTEKVRMINDVNSVHANTNGYDVQPRDSKGKNIIAEVKCNIPVDNNSFGPAQKEGIIKDINNLLKGKNKAKIIDTSSFYKFMVILDCAENVRVCMQKIIDVQENVKVYDSPNNLDTHNVFVAYVKIDNCVYDGK